METVEKLKTLMKWLSDNQWLNLIFLFFAILSIIVSVYLYAKSKRKKSPVYSIRSTNVVSDSLQSLGDILVTYLGRPVENLTITKIAIWNSGNDTLSSSDQAPTDKLRIVAEDGILIFKADVIYESSTTNNIKVKVNENIIEFYFDYFDPNQGGLIKIVYSGKKSNNLLVKEHLKEPGL